MSGAQAALGWPCACVLTLSVTCRGTWCAGDARSSGAAA